MKVENPGGARILIVTYTIISERPIEHNNVLVNGPSIYRVAEVCFQNIFAQRLMLVKDYATRNENPDGIVRIINYGDPEGDDTAKDFVDKSWRMDKLVNDHLDNLLGQEDEQGETDLNAYHDQNTAGNPYGNKVMKQGAKPKAIVENTAALIDFKIQCGKLSVVNYYVFVDYEDKNYIFTLRYVLEFLSRNFRALLKSSAEKYFLKQELNYV